MVRRVLLATMLLAVPATAAQAGAGTAPLSAAQLASVRVTSCSRADHTAAFYARMRRTAPGQTLKLRYTLLERGADGHFRPVDAPALARWRTSKPDVKAFGYRQKVKGLAGDSAYRARVDFRWYSAGGIVVHRERRRSRVCSQSGPLPNLRARTIGHSPALTPGMTRYTVRLANAGALGADDVDVRFAVEGASSETKMVGHVAPGAAANLTFVAPDCSSAVTATADPDDRVNETVETDNAQRLGCADIP